ncbi:MAG: hypothetical protein CMN76_10385 [Spirochaetaceae bacterium]|nr:hypothetical protein [Spirochaetaceae bacterium]|tara:strand:+ start:43602 stop:44189 length:588 start_codon:yes stop_codon:yes gene_type:complete
MSKIQPSDIMPLDQYDRIRDEYRQRIFQVKKSRRVAVGDYLTFLFENQDTMKYQIQEMARVEQLKDPEAVKHEIETYNELVPDPNEITASLLIEINDPAARAFKLKELVGLQDSVSMLIDKDYQVQAEFDDRQITDGKISSVHYLRFPLGQKAADAFLSTSSVEILITHPACSYRQELNPDQLEAMKEDLKASRI